MIATIIYALPPMIHNTTLALKAVPDELREFGTMVGCTPYQMMRKILLPSALSGLMVGVNLVILSSLNMVIIASMIGAGGLGYDVLFSLRRLDIGAGMEAGLAIVVLAIALDRLSQALATRHPPARKTTSRAFPLNYPRSFLCVAVIAATWIGGNWIEALQTFPEGWQISTRQYWGELVKAINLNFYDQLEAVKLFFLATLLLPVKGFMLGLPWAWVIGLIALGGYKLGGWRLALLGTMLFGFILLTGQWDYAMISLYLCGVSVLLAILIGAPLGILAAEVKGFSRVMRVAVDTLQTLPTFVYLIPVVMLFNSGDFSALIAVTLYAVVPVIRYTAHGLDQVSPNLIEAGKMIGCSKWQILTKIKLPLAAPHMMLGLSQTIMFALSMLVITALVGTRDLGQQVYTALSQADPGLGLIAGLSVAFIAIVTDRFAAVAAKWLTAGG
jgi:glycine betaine/proline transport system permease protein